MPVPDTAVMRPMEPACTHGPSFSGLEKGRLGGRLPHHATISEALDRETHITFQLGRRRQAAHVLGQRLKQESVHKGGNQASRIVWRQI